MSRHQELLAEFIQTVWGGHGMKLVIASPAEHDEIVKGRSNLYYDHGVIPPSVSFENHVVLLGICPERLVEGTEWMTDDQFADYLEWWTSRVQIRLTKMVELAPVGDDNLIEDLVDVAMNEYAYPQSGWWK